LGYDSEPLQYVAVPVADPSPVPSSAVEVSMLPSNHPSHLADMVRPSESPVVYEANERTLRPTPDTAATVPPTPAPTGAGDGDPYDTVVTGQKGDLVASSMPTVRPTKLDVPDDFDATGIEKDFLPTARPSKAPTRESPTGSPGELADTDTNEGSLQHTALPLSMSVSHTATTSAEEMLLDVENEVEAALMELLNEHEQSDPRGKLAVYSTGIASVQATISDNVPSCVSSSRFDDCTIVDLAITASFDQGVAKGEIEYIIAQHLDSIIGRLFAAYDINNFGPNVGIAENTILLLNVTRLPNEEETATFEEVVGRFLERKLGADVAQPITDIKVEVVSSDFVDGDVRRRRLRQAIGISSIVSGLYRGPKIDMDRKINDAIDGNEYEIDTELKMRQKYYQQSDGIQLNPSPPLGSEAPSHSPTVLAVPDPVPADVQDAPPPSPPNRPSKAVFAVISLLGIAFMLLIVSGVLYRRRKANNTSSGRGEEGHTWAECNEFESQQVSANDSPNNFVRFATQGMVTVWNSTSTLDIDNASTMESNASNASYSVNPSGRSDVMPALETDEYTRGQVWSRQSAEEMATPTNAAKPGAFHATAASRMERENSWKVALNRMWRKEEGTAVQDDVDEMGARSVHNDGDDDQTKEGRGQGSTAGKSVSFMQMNVFGSTVLCSQGDDNTITTADPQSFRGQQRHGYFSGDDDSAYDDDDDDDEEQINDHT